MLHEDQAHLLGDVSASSVLEIGCGSAPCTQWLQSRAHFATGFDISRGMLNHAAPGLPLAQADALSLPYATGSFDVAFSAFGAFPFLANLDLALSEVSRVLKPGGRFVLSANHPMRWIFPDDPTDLTADISYFDRAYLEQDREGKGAGRRHRPRPVPPTRAVPGPWLGGVGRAVGQASGQEAGIR